MAGHGDVDASELPKGREEAGGRREEKADRESRTRAFGSSAAVYEEMAFTAPFAGRGTALA